jgi:hypothetical protein
MRSANGEKNIRNTFTVRQCKKIGKSQNNIKMRCYCGNEAGMA